MERLQKILITQLRDAKSTRVQFRQAAAHLTHLLAAQAAQALLTQKIACQTPIALTEGLAFDQKIVLLPILRAGLALVPGFLSYFPDAAVSIIGLRRDEQTAQAQVYYENLTSIGSGDKVIILDPMIATGGTAVAALRILAEKGVRQEQVLFVAVVSAPEGLQAIKESFPDVEILVAQQDEKLNDKKFIVPGLGDFGDRFFGTD